MANPKGASIGPQLPTDLGKNVNGGMSISDPRSPDYAAGQIQDQNAKQAKVVLDDDGNILTDAPEPTPPPPPQRTMRKAPQTQGPVVDNDSGVYRPAMYVIKRDVDLGNGNLFQHKAVREDR